MSKATTHESAVGHVSGRAIYADEQHPPAGLLSLYPVQAPHAHARILAIDTAAARALPGVHAVLTAADIPGTNDLGPIVHDEPVMPADHVSYFGQAVAWVVADSEEQAMAAARQVKVEYEALPALLDVHAAIAADSFHLPPARVERGDVSAGLAAATHRLSGELLIGGQDHFYLETQACWASIDSEGLVQLVSSTQHPSETQHMVAHVLGIASHRVICRCLRMGGGFGGKETQANPFAAVAALAAWKTGRPARVKLHRALDMQLTGKRHPFFARFTVGFDDDGLLQAARIDLVADGGWSVDLSPPVLMRAMVHVDNAYFIPHVEVQGRIAKTHLASNTAFRGFGGPQGMVVGEEILDRVARFLGLPVDQVRERNFYREGCTPDRNQTHYGQPVVDNHLPELWAQLRASSAYDLRRAELDAFNREHPQRKRGLAITPVKFGISFNKTEYNQAGALVLIYSDGSVQLNHGGTEMGQGLHTKMLAVAAHTLGISQSRIQIMVTSTDKVPNTSATAASSGSDLNGQAVKAACETLLARMAPIAAASLRVHPLPNPSPIEGEGLKTPGSDHSSPLSPGGREVGRQGADEAADIVFADDRVFHRDRPEHSLAFDDVVRSTYNARVSLAATGYYRTPGLRWDPKLGRGHPFYYFAFGAAVCEVEVCGLTGVHSLRRVDLLHDVGDSIAELIDRGQIEGGFVQGMGWLTSEELRWNAQGRLLTDAPSTYKIPTVGDVPEDFRVDLFRRSKPPSTNVIFHSKGVGEPPLMLAIAVREAIRDAVAAFGDARVVELASPSTPEAIYHAIVKVRGA